MGSLLLGDLDDYIAPAQDCVVALTKGGGGGRVTLVAVDDDAATSSGGAPGPSPPPPISATRPLTRPLPPVSPGRDPRGQQLVKKKRGEAPPPSLVAPTADEAIKISLSDCLVCSGCVTSAEAVLLEAHGVADFVARAGELAAANSRLAVTVCPQAAASLGARLGVSPQAAFAKLGSCVARRHAPSGSTPILLSSDEGRFHALREAADEFVGVWRDRLASAGEVERCAGEEVCDQDPGSSARLPVFASACPGWVCYCEKVLHDALPHLSRVRSPQQTVGAMLKAGRPLHAGGAGRGADSPEEGGAVFHVTVMPCYEKKLESLRPDFAPGGVRDVDASLTTSEALELVGRDAGGGALESEELGSLGARALLEAESDGALEAQFLAASSRCASLFPPGSSPSSSGGYADYVYARVAADVYGMSGPALVPAWRPARNSPDLVQATLEADAPDGSKQDVRFARVYGFKNIQNVVRRLKTGRLPYDYVEIMACPSGCVNGGGQLPPETTQGRALDSKTRRDHTARVEALYREAVHGGGSAGQGWGSWPPPPPAPDALLRTGFHPIPKLEATGLTSAKLAW